MKQHQFLLLRALPAALLAGAVLVFTTGANPAAPGGEAQLSISRIYWEYNASANDLGVHVTLDGENWKRLKILKPDKSKIFEVKGSGPYHDLGMTELFFEGAEPNLDDFPLADLLALFPEGVYDFEGLTVDGRDIEGEGTFTHAIPAGPRVRAQQGANDFLRISWSEVTSPPAGFPSRPIVISGYQVIVGKFQVTLPGSARSVTVSPEFVASLAPGEQPFEVLAIEVGGNQTLTEGVFVR